MTYTQFDDPKTCYTKKEEKAHDHYEQKTASKIQRQKKCWEKNNGEMKISHNYQRHSRKINFH